MRTPPSPAVSDWRKEFSSRPLPSAAAAQLVGVNHSADEPLDGDEAKTVAVPFFQSADHPTRDLAESNGAAEAGVCAVQHSYEVRDDR